VWDAIRETGGWCMGATTMDGWDGKGGGGG
jgi:hypothetical protein